MNFLDYGDGTYLGNCEITGSDESTLCEIGAAACGDFTNSVVSNLIAYGSCGAIGALAAAAATAGSEGVALPAAGIIDARVALLCSVAIGYGLNVYCSHEHPSGSTCPQTFWSNRALFTADLFNDSPDPSFGTVYGNGPGTSTVHGEIGTACSVTVNPFPTGIFPAPCPADNPTLGQNVIKLCDSCYSPGAPELYSEPFGDGVEPLLDIYCDLCCGCCYPTDHDADVAIGDPENPQCCNTGGIAGYLCPDPCSTAQCSPPSPQDQCAGSSYGGYCAVPEYFVQVVPKDCTYDPLIGYPARVFN
jgi:hypothetical protein